MDIERDGGERRAPVGGYRENEARPHVPDGPIDRHGVGQRGRHARARGQERDRGRWRDNDRSGLGHRAPVRGPCSRQRQRQARASHATRTRPGPEPRAQTALFSFHLFFFVCFFFLFFSFVLSLSLSLAFLFSSFFTRLAWPLFLGHTRPRRACSPSRISLSASLLLLLLLLRSSGGMIDATSCGTPRLRPGINCYRETAL